MSDSNSIIDESFLDDENENDFVYDLNINEEKALLEEKCSDEEEILDLNDDYNDMNVTNLSEDISFVQNEKPTKLSDQVNPAQDKSIYLNRCKRLNKGEIQSNNKRTRRKRHYRNKGIFSTKRNQFLYGNARSVHQNLHIKHKIHPWITGNAGSAFISGSSQPFYTSQQIQPFVQLLQHQSLLAHDQMLLNNTPLQIKLPVHQRLGQPSNHYSQNMNEFNQIESTQNFHSIENENKSLVLSQNQNGKRNKNIVISKNCNDMSSFNFVEPPQLKTFSNSEMMDEDKRNNEYRHLQARNCERIILIKDNKFTRQYLNGNSKKNGEFENNISNNGNLINNQSDKSGENISNEYISSFLSNRKVSAREEFTANHMNNLPTTSAIDSNKINLSGKVGNIQIMSFLNQ